MSERFERTSTIEKPQHKKVNVWRAPYECTVVCVRAIKGGSGDVGCIARKNGVEFARVRAGSSFELGALTFGGAALEFEVGDSLVIEVVEGAGADYLTVQVEFEKK